MCGWHPLCARCWGPARPPASSLMKPCQPHSASPGTWSPSREPSQSTPPADAGSTSCSSLSTVPSAGPGAGHSGSTVTIIQWDEGRGRERKEKKERGEGRGTLLLEGPSNLCPEGKGPPKALSGSSFMCKDHSCSKMQERGKVSFQHACLAHLSCRGVYLPNFQELQKKKKKKATMPSSTVLIFQILIFGISASGPRHCWYSSACLCL